MANKTVKFLANGSPRFKFEGEFFQVKPGFNEMDAKFSKDPYYDLCKKGGIVKDFVSGPSDKDQENFQKQIKSERKRAEKAEAENEQLKKQLAEFQKASEGSGTNETK